jgi:hypothetical protein
MTIDAAATMLRAATHLDAAAAATAKALEADGPKLFFRGRAKAVINGHFAEALRQGQQAVRELEGLGGPLEDARAGIREAIARNDPAVHTDLHHLRDFRDNAGVQGRLEVFRDRLRLQAELDGLPVADARARVTQELDTLLDTPADRFTNDELLRLAVLEGLPSDLRPRFPRPVRDWYGLLGASAVHRWDGSERIAAAEVRNLQLDRERRFIEADPSASLASFDNELRSILAKPHEQLTHDDLDRISIMAGLPQRLRPSLLDVPNPWPTAPEPLDQLGPWRYGHHVSDGAVRSRLDAMRMGVEHEAMLADPTVTKETVTRDVAAILATPTEQLDLEDMQRLSLLLRLPDHLRPALPAPIDSHHVIENLGLLRAVPAQHVTAAKIYDAARTELLADLAPEVLVQALREKVAAGGEIDLRTAAALARRDPALLEQAGVSADRLRDQAIAALAAGTQVRVGSVEEHLAFTRAGIEALQPTDPAQLAMRDELLATIDRNLDRIRGRRTDTFGRHPDYAEVGRVAENARLLHLLSQATPRPSAVAPATVARPAEVLPW